MGLQVCRRECYKFSSCVDYSTVSRIQGQGEWQEGAMSRGRTFERAALWGKGTSRLIYRYHMKIYAINVR